MKDPVEERSDGTRDLYDVATWEPRTALDRLAVGVYRVVLAAARAIVILIAVLILLLILAQGIGATFVNDPYSVGLVVLSVVPALALAAYVYVADITTSEPLSLLVATFILGVLFAGFAAIVNTLLQPLLAWIPVIGIVLFFYLVVGPVEETVKWLAVRLWAFRDERFDAVIDGAVYGAVAGLGFATIENALYITRKIGNPGEAGNAIVGGVLAAATLTAGTLGMTGVGGSIQLGGVGRIFGNIIGAGGQITAVRALAGPGHIIYSAFAGYYLGLAKFNPDRAGPIAVKGLLIAAFIHATYNTLVGIVTPLAVGLTGANQLTVFFAFVVVYDGFFGYILYRKLSRYRSAYKTVHGEEGREEGTISPERTEFDG